MIGIQITAPAATSGPIISRLLLRISGCVLALDVAAMHALAPAMSAGYPHLSAFGWSLIAGGYLALGGLIVGLGAVHRRDDADVATHPVDVSDPGRQEPVRTLDDPRTAEAAGSQRGA